MNWDALTPILEKSIEKVNSIKDIDNRMAMLVFYVAEMVEAETKESCAKLCNTLAGDMTASAEWAANTCATAIRSNEQQ
jgi:hypothetical protein